MEEAVERLVVAGHHLRIIANRVSLSKEAAKHGTCMIGGKRYAGLLRGALHARTQLRGAFKQWLVETGRGYNFHCRKTRGHCNGVARESACLIAGASWRHLLHNVALAADSANRHAAPE